MKPHKKNPYKVGDTVKILHDIRDAYGEIWHYKGDEEEVESIAIDGEGLMFGSHLGIHFSEVEPVKSSLNPEDFAIKVIGKEKCDCTDGKETCYVCNGKGKEHVKGWFEYGSPNGVESYDGPCRKCNGEKKVTCSKCKGSRISDVSSITIKQLKELLEIK